MEIGSVPRTAGSSNYAAPLTSLELLNYYLTLAMNIEDIEEVDNVHVGTSLNDKLSCVTISNLDVLYFIS